MRASDFRTGRHVVYALMLTWSSSRSIVARSSRRGSSRSCGELAGGVRPLRVRAARVGLRVRPRASVGRVPAEGIAFDARQLAQGRVGSEARQPHIPEVERKLWGPHFWSPSYCAVSCGGAPLEIVKRYIQEQAGDGTQNSCGIPDEELVTLLAPPPTPRGAVPPRPKGRGFPADIR